MVGLAVWENGWRHQADPNTLAHQREHRIEAIHGDVLAKNTATALMLALQPCEDGRASPQGDERQLNELLDFQCRRFK